MSASRPVPTVAELHDFVRARHGTEFATLHRDRTFAAFMEGDRLRIRTAGSERSVASTEEVLAVFRSTRSFKPSVYRATGTFNASYLLALVAAWQEQEHGVRHGSGSLAENAAAPALTESARLRLVNAVASAAASLDCAVRDSRLKYGIEIERRNGKLAWVGSVYWGQNNPGNEVEIAIDLRRLAARPGVREAERLSSWFRYTVGLLENEPAANHSSNNEGWFRAGFKLDDALDLFDRLKKQSHPLLREDERWVVPSEPVHDAAGDACAQPATPQIGPFQEPVFLASASPESASIRHMISMAHLACESSGRVAETIAKTKRFCFADDAALESHVADLIERQGRCCAITSLPLHFKGVGEVDAHLLASLDRIDSDGHYEAGNLQVVCRFVNQWKSDDSDENFRRLIALVRSSSGAPFQAWSGVNSSADSGR